MKETGVEQAQLIQTVLQAGKKHQRVNGVTYRTVSIASDGKSKCRDALVKITMCWSLSPMSPIYTQLQPLRFLNLLVGEDDITADKDFKWGGALSANGYSCLVIAQPSQNGQMECSSTLGGN